MARSLVRRSSTVFIVVLLVVGAVPGLAAAQSGVGGSIVVAEGQTVSQVNAVGGDVIVRGTVTGDVNAAAGNVVVAGTVQGDVNVATGNLRIIGAVGGDVSAGAGNVDLAETGTVAGNVEVGAGDVRIDGTIGGDARIGAETIHLGETASIAGSLTYDGRLTGNEGAVAGDVTRDRTLGPTSLTELQPLRSWVAALYAFIANLLLGTALLALFPRFSEAVADRVAFDPIRVGLVGLGVLLGVPLLLVLAALTIVGIPLALGGSLLFLFVAWVGLVYGRFALGMWLLSLASGTRSRNSVDEGDGLADRPDARWIGLILGLVIGGGVALVPVVGDLVNLLVFLLGLGALTAVLYEHRGRTGGPSGEQASATPTTG